MSYTNQLRPGKRKNAYYVKTGVRRTRSYAEDYEEMPEEIYVYEWNDEKKKHVGHLVNAAQYYEKSRCS